jgi:micrococcal nuclease
MITLVAACLLVACACGTAPLPDGVAIVEEVVDGDTLVVRVGSGTERVRLLGIDTPETVHPTKPVECFGPEASRELKRLAPAGSQLRLGRDTELRDRYGRLLAHAWNAEGTFINEALVEGGFATTLFIDPNRAYRQELRAAQDRAESARAGQWSACQ